MQVTVTIDGRDQVRLDLPENYFGLLQVQFVDGEIVLIRKEETIKPVLFVVSN